MNRRRFGYGHLYQGRYKSFPVESDDHLYQVVRYVERNALRANLVGSRQGCGLALVKHLTDAAGPRQRAVHPRRAISARSSR